MTNVRIFLYADSEWPLLNTKVRCTPGDGDFDKIRLGEVLRELTTHGVCDADVLVVWP